MYLENSLKVLLQWRRGNRHCESNFPQSVVAAATDTIYIRCQSPKYENGFKHLWHRVKIEKLMMKIYDFFYSAKSFSHPVKYCVKNLPSSR